MSFICNVAPQHAAKRVRVHRCSGEYGCFGEDPCPVLVRISLALVLLERMNCVSLIKAGGARRPACVQRGTGKLATGRAEHGGGTEVSVTVQQSHTYGGLKPIAMGTNA